jgi:hypothetical protein
MEVNMIEKQLVRGKWYQILNYGRPLYVKNLCFDGVRGDKLAFYNGIGVHYYFPPSLLNDPGVQINLVEDKPKPVQVKQKTYAPDAPEIIAALDARKYCRADTYKNGISHTAEVWQPVPASNWGYCFRMIDNESGEYFPVTPCGSLAKLIRLMYDFSDKDWYIWYIVEESSDGDTEPVTPITDDDILIDEPIPTKPKDTFRLRLRPVTTDAYPYDQPRYDQLLTRVQELTDLLHWIDDRMTWFDEKEIPVFQRASRDIQRRINEVLVRHPIQEAKHDPS